MKIGVYGLGRFGRFWAELLSSRFDVYAFNRTNREMPAGVKSLSLAKLACLDTVFLCVSISSFSEVVREISPLLAPDSLVVDTCSVKVFPVRVMLEGLPAACPVLASHPMFGPDSGRNGVGGLPMIMHPVRIADERFRFWAGFFRELGLRVIEMSPEAHDREAAFTQGITHFIGRVLRELDLKESPIGTLGYRRLLDIMEQTCNDPVQLFLDLQRYNSHTPEMRSRLKSALEDIMVKLDS
jgi:prephenate dehydrogenase